MNINKVEFTSSSPLKKSHQSISHFSSYFVPILFWFLLEFNIHNFMHLILHFGLSFWFLGVLRRRKKLSTIVDDPCKYVSL